MSNKRRIRKSSYGIYVDKIYKETYSKTIQEISEKEIQNYVETFIKLAWKHAAAHPDPSKTESLRHFVPQFFIDKQGLKPDYEIFSTKNDGNGELTSLKPKYEDFIQKENENEFYSAQLEQFLSYIEAITAEELTFLNISNQILSEKDFNLFSDEILDNAYYKIIFSIFLSSQWYRTPITRSSFLKINSEIPFDSQIYSGILKGALILARRKWVWIQENNSNLFFPPEPFFVYAIEASEIPESERNVLNLTNDELIGKKYTSLQSSPAQMIPFGSNLLLYITVFNEVDLWMMVDEDTKVIGIPTSSKTIDQSFLNANLKYEKNRESIAKIVIDNEEKILQGKLTTTYNISLGELVFGEYNYLSAFMNDWVLVKKNILYPAQRIKIEDKL